MITADLGITAIPEVEFAGELGQDVIIVDHHSVPAETPDAFATINPRLPDSSYGFTELSTGGLAYRIAPLILDRFGQRAEASRWLDLATLSTVADVVPLEGENRTLVRDGLVAIRDTTRPGLRALLDVAGLWDGELDTDSIAFALAPRINAAGRLAHARMAFDLLTETDPDRARPAAEELDRLNLQRRQMTADAMQRAADALAGQDDGAADAPLTFVQDPGISSGIVGLVAGRLAEERHRPAIVCEEGPELSRASCRSIPEFDIAQALRDRGHLFVKHGGHAMAAGFTARTSELGAIQASLTALAGERLADVALHPRVQVDGQISLDRLAGAAGRVAATAGAVRGGQSRADVRQHGAARRGRETRRGRREPPEAAAAGRRPDVERDRVPAGDGAGAARRSGGRRLEPAQGRRLRRPGAGNPRPRARSRTRRGAAIGVTTRGGPGSPRLAYTGVPCIGLP